MPVDDEELDVVEHKRSNAVGELVATERRFVADLRCLCFHWRPWLQWKGDLPRAVLDKLFGNSETLLTLHSALLKDLEGDVVSVAASAVGGASAAKGGPPQTAHLHRRFEDEGFTLRAKAQIGGTLLRFADSLRLHAIYVANDATSRSTLEQLQSSRSTSKVIAEARDALLRGDFGVPGHVQPGAAWYSDDSDCVDLPNWSSEDWSDSGDDEGDNRSDSVVSTPGRKSSSSSSSSSSIPGVDSSYSSSPSSDSTKQRSRGMSLSRKSKPKPKNRERSRPHNYKRKRKANAAFKAGMGGNATQLSDFLIKPLQRLCKYPLLLREVIKFTPENTEEHAKLLKAEQAVKHAVAQVNAAQKQRDLGEEMLELQNRVSGGNIKPHLVHKTDYVREGNLVLCRKPSLKSAAKGQVDDVIVRLFNDLLLVTKQIAKPTKGKTAGTELVLHQLNLEVAVCQNGVSGPITSGKSVGTDTAFEVSVLAGRDASARFLFFARSVADKASWIADLERTIQSAQDTARLRDLQKPYQDELNPFLGAEPSPVAPSPSVAPTPSFSAFPTPLVPKRALPQVPPNKSLPKPPAASSLPTTPQSLQQRDEQPPSRPAPRPPSRTVSGTSTPSSVSRPLTSQSSDSLVVPKADASPAPKLGSLPPVASRSSPALETPPAIPAKSKSTSVSSLVGPRPVPKPQDKPQESAPLPRKPTPTTPKVPVVVASSLSPSDVLRSDSPPVGTRHMSFAERTRYAQLFDKADADGDGVVNGAEGKEFFSAAAKSLARAQLRAIWGIADKDSSGHLDIVAFALAVHLVYMAIRGEALPTSSQAWSENWWALRAIRSGVSSGEDSGSASAPAAVEETPPPLPSKPPVRPPKPSKLG